MRAEQQNEAPHCLKEKIKSKESSGYLGQPNETRKKKQKKEKPRHEVIRYDQDNIKECFVERLVMTLNAAEITHEQMSKLGTFKGILKSQWNRIRHIVYHSKEEPVCSICLETTFTAPQMTSCGHVFCWPCIYIHSKKSLKAVFCPVCNQAYEIDHLVTCRPVYSRSFPELKDNKVRFSLKGRREGDNRIYDYDTLEENLDFSRVIRATPQTILSLFEEQRKEVQQAFEICEDELVMENMSKILVCSTNKIAKARELVEKKEHRTHHHRRDRLQKGYYHSILDKRQKNKLITFYQEYTGRMIYLHPICDKYIRKGTKQLPLIIEQEIIEWQDTEYSFDLLKYFQISHLTVNQEIDLVIVDIEPLIEDQKLKGEFREQLEVFKNKKMEEMERQEKESARLSAQYKKKQKIKIEIQKMKEQEFQDIKLPGPVDTKEIESPTLFPSLFETRSLPDPQKKKQKREEGKPQQEDKDQILENQDEVPAIILRKDSDPDTFFDIPQALQTSKSEDVYISQNQKRFEGKKKKKEYVNVTGLFFNSNNTGGSV